MKSLIIYNEKYKKEKMFIQINKQLISKNKYSIKCPYEMTVKWIVIHNIYSDTSAQNEVKYMQSNDKPISYHFAVDDKQIIQVLPLDRNAWHAGDGEDGEGNRNGIAIEICYSKSGGERFIQAERNAAWLAAKLLKDYDLDISHLKKHQDFANKYCPHRTLDLGWDRFVKMVIYHLQALSQRPNFNILNFQYYPRYLGSSNSLIEALQSLNIPSSFEARQKIALKNGINHYKGELEQNIL